MAASSRTRRPWPTPSASATGSEGSNCCDSRRADQKGGCERNHSEIRKLLPKGKGIRFDLLTRRGTSLLMSEADSEPRGKLAWPAPATPSPRPSERTRSTSSRPSASRG